MQPVLHSSCSAPVPYVSGMTALEIDTCVRAGFPSPAEDFQAERIDVLKYIVLHPQATYTLRVRGDSMRDEGIFDGDVILVDRAIKPRHGHIVVAVVDGLAEAPIPKIGPGIIPQLYEQSWARPILDEWEANSLIDKTVKNAIQAKKKLK